MESSDADYRKDLNELDRYYKEGVAALQSGATEKAKEAFLNALNRAERLGEATLISALHHQLARVAVMTGSYRESRIRCRRSLKIGEPAGISVNLAAANYFHLGRVSAMLGEAALARAYYLKAAPLLKEAKEWTAFATCAYLLAKSYWGEQDRENTKKWLLVMVKALLRSTVVEWTGKVRNVFRTRSE